MKIKRADTDSNKTSGTRNVIGTWELHAAVIANYISFQLSIPPRIAMGGAVSSGQNNRELVDNLCYEDYIQSPEVEKVRQI